MIQDTHSNTYSERSSPLVVEKEMNALEAFDLSQEQIVPGCHKGVLPPPTMWANVENQGSYFGMWASVDSVWTRAFLWAVLGSDRQSSPKPKECFALWHIPQSANLTGHGLPFYVVSAESASGFPPSHLPLRPGCLGSLLQSVFTAKKLPTLPFILIFRGSLYFLLSKTNRSWVPFFRHILNSMQLALLAFEHWAGNPCHSQVQPIGLPPGLQPPWPENAASPPPGRGALSWRSLGAQTLIHV